MSHFLLRRRHGRQAFLARCRRLMGAGAAAVSGGLVLMGLEFMMVESGDIVWGRIIGALCASVHVRRVLRNR